MFVLVSTLLVWYHDFFWHMIYLMLGTYFLNHLQREKKNLLDINGVFIFDVAEREFLDRPTARLIKEFDCVEGKSYTE